MLELIQKNLIVNRKFDPDHTRHYLNGELTVLHCHHYATLYTQLAIDANETALLAEVAEETFYKTLSAYFQKHQIQSLEERIEIACQYFVNFGLGQMHVQYLGDDSGEIILTHSHVDEGWLKKWGTFDKPVNYIGAGFIAAMFAAVHDKAVGSFNVQEQKSIVSGAENSLFKVYKN